MAFALFQATVKLDFLGREAVPDAHESPACLGSWEDMATFGSKSANGSQGSGGSPPPVRGQLQPKSIRLQVCLWQPGLRADTWATVTQKRCITFADHEQANKQTNKNFLKICIYKTF